MEVSGWAPITSLNMFAVMGFELQTVQPLALSRYQLHYFDSFSHEETFIFNFKKYEINLI